MKQSTRSRNRQIQRENRARAKFRVSDVSCNGWTVASRRCFEEIDVPLFDESCPCSIAAGNRRSDRGLASTDIVLHAHPPSLWRYQGFKGFDGSLCGFLALWVHFGFVCDWEPVILERIFVRGVTCIYDIVQTNHCTIIYVRTTRTEYEIRLIATTQRYVKMFEEMITRWVKSNLLIRSFFTSTSVRNIPMIFLIQVKELKKAECKLFGAEDARCFLVRDKWHDSIKRCGWKKRELHLC